MPRLPRLLRPRTLLNPVSRLAVTTFAWTHRHEILRWGRTLYDQVVGRSDVSPARAVRTGAVLFAVASDRRFRDAKQLRKVSYVGDHVDLVVDERWRQLPDLVERVGSVKGVASVSVNGVPVTPAHAVAS